MNFIDSMLDIVKNAPVSGVDLNFVKTIDPVKNYNDLESKPEYRVLIDMMNFIYTDSIKRGVDPKHASALIISVHEDVLKYVISKRIKEKLTSMDVESVLGLGEALRADDLKQKIKETEKQLLKLKESFDVFVGKLPIAQFKYSLLYAANKWGNEEEINVVEKLVSKIEDVEIKK